MLISILSSFCPTVAVIIDLVGSGRRLLCGGGGGGKEEQEDEDEMESVSLLKRGQLKETFLKRGNSKNVVSINETK
jgi:hypothetical protein